MGWRAAQGAAKAWQCDTVRVEEELWVVGVLACEAQEGKTVKSVDIHTKESGSYSEENQELLKIWRQSTYYVFGNDIKLR